ncbi:MAG: hypothetical protein DRJ05_03905 [Bacteroidetes bacterium]|nr:MAG: hypothetical protein DRJ05_03905 [Bacteroidota bacterium]
MKIIIDTNIVFSAVINSQGKIGDFIFKSSNCFHFYSADYLLFELSNHREKLKKLSKLSDARLTKSLYHISRKIRFIDEQIIPREIWVDSEKNVSEIDIDDVNFESMTKYLNGILWIGDKRLHKGLKKSKFIQVMNTNELLEFRNEILTRE